MESVQLPRHYRRNFWCFMLDFGFFGVAMSFISTSTVIPGFLIALGASSTFIGLISSLQGASWLLPQLFAARILGDKPCKKPYILWPAAMGRSLILVMAILIWSTQARTPAILLIAMVVLVTGFWAGDGVASVPWFDLLSKVIPPRRRGRLTGIGQVLSGSMSFLVGLGVEWMLSSSGPAFPNNYALLFLSSFTMLSLSFAATAAIVEETCVPDERNPSWREYIPQLVRVLKRDHVFRRFILARQLSALGGLAIPFYMPYAIQQLGLPIQVAGRYTSLGVLGSILSAVAFGWLNERYGSKRVILLSLAIGLLVPILALGIPVLLPNPVWLAWGYGLVFLCLNGMMMSMMPGWMTYVLEWAPERERPTYVGLTNTLNGVTTLFATLGGLILHWTGNNYRLLFIITIVGLLAAVPLPLTLPEPRHKRAEVEG